MPLSLAYDIVTKRHGGTMEVESKEGEGTTFVVKLPRGFGSAQPRGTEFKQSLVERSRNKGYMYILECADGSYYTGSTIDLERRLFQHQNGEGANHTKNKRGIWSQSSAG